MTGFVLVSVVLLVCGLVFRVGKKVQLLAGYKDEDYEDKDGLANWIGNVILVMSVLSLGSILIAYLIEDPIHGKIIGALYLIVMMYGVGITVITGCQRFKKK